MDLQVVLQEDLVQRHLADLYLHFGFLHDYHAPYRFWHFLRVVVNEGETLAVLVRQDHEREVLHFGLQSVLALLY